MKIKWNDDRVRAAATALLLISRERLARGITHDLIAASLAEFRADPAGYKNLATRADGSGAATMLAPGNLVRYQSLSSAVDQLLKQWARNKRQFNSLLELDNAFVAHLKQLG
jgi:hypothetical protein